MRREIIQTADGSSTIYIPELDETYHSRHGSIQEARHVFISNGFDYFQNNGALRILEIGFGTGLNCILTLEASLKLSINVEYVGVEAYPVEMELVEKLNYPIENLDKEFNKVHSISWNEEIEILPNFKLNKIDSKIQEVDFNADSYDVIYFDAFGPRAQSEMWSLEILKKMYDCLNSYGFLVTYCAKGQFKRDLKSLGFRVENLPGPPGKREMTRAWKD